VSITRRQLLIGAGGVMALTTTGALGLVACGGDEEPATPADATRPDVDGLDAIGVAYVAVTPDEDRRDAVLAALGLDAPADADTVVDDAALDPTTLLAARATSIRSDYATGEVVELDGWVLSRTEARIAALAAFRSGALAG